MKSPTWKDWAYLAASVAASYYLVMQQRGDDQNIEMRILWSSVKTVRTVRRALGRLEARLANELDAVLERGRSV